MRTRLPRPDPDAPPELRLGWRGPARILFVDERPGKLESTSAALRKRGYAVRADASPRLALERWRVLGKRYDALVASASMTEMSSIELARHALEIQGDLKLLLIAEAWPSCGSTPWAPPLALTQQAVDLGCQYAILEEPCVHRRLCECLFDLLHCTPPRCRGDS